MHEADHGVEQHHGEHHDGSLEFARYDETHDCGDEQDADQNIAELVEKPQPGRSAGGFGEFVATMLDESLSGCG